METATETNPNWLYLQEVTAKLRQTEKQAETIKENLRQLNSAWAARPQLHHIHRPREEQPDAVSSQVERKARDLSDWPLLLKKEAGIRRHLMACLGPSCRGLRLCGKGFRPSTPAGEARKAYQDQPQAAEPAERAKPAQAPAQTTPAANAQVHSFAPAVAQLSDKVQVQQPMCLQQTEHRQVQQQLLPKQQQQPQYFQHHYQLHRTQPGCEYQIQRQVQREYGAAMQRCMPDMGISQQPGPLDALPIQKDFGSTAHQQMEGVTAKLCQIEKQAETIKDNLRQLNSAWEVTAKLRQTEKQAETIKVGRKARDLSDWPLLLKKEAGISLCDVLNLKHWEWSRKYKSYRPELPEEPCLERHAAVDDAHDTLTTLPEHLPRDLKQKYKFIDAHSLGSGAVARVCRMQELETGRHVAVKVVEKYPLKIRNMITQMEREIRVHKRLRHPNILHLHACFEDSTHWYMVLELASRLVNLLLRFPWKRLREPQVVDGVSHLHQNGCGLEGCVHRDLKPDNVLMVEDCPKICDFGWCAELNEGQRRTFCGTFDYMAPEVIFGEGHGSEADVWSLGITLYEVCHLVNCMLQRYPHQRYTASKVLEHKWLATFFLKPKQALPWSLVSATLAYPQRVALMEGLERGQGRINLLRIHLTSLAESCSRGEHQLEAKVSAAVPPHAVTEAYPRACLDLSWGSTLAHYEIRAESSVDHCKTWNAHFAQRSGRCPWTAMHAEAESANVAVQGGAVSSGRAPYPAHGAGITVAAGPFPTPAPGSPIIAGRPVRKVAAPHEMLGLTKLLEGLYLAGTRRLRDPVVFRGPPVTEL
ncbi:Serine/threonine-protein kinase PLK4 [Symbiodinium microadriaticum]|uniref:Serine/threonine-protein kinase PLK4 n=1 Tax=Symbiodinium microadriaticum TaxID=2951 RepID=A0A1Q9EJ43_SYMMI|nr:Serine/threonine-protein kinase PLK4 [Symbiodinium microadriaticum]